LITLTPGTLSLDISPDHKTLYIHAMHVDDVDEFRQEIKQRMERRVMEVFQ
jgi:multicomponent Na+:H+ antiporter subunit E